METPTSIDDEGSLVVGEGELEGGVRLGLRSRCIRVRLTSRRNHGDELLLLLGFSVLDDDDSTQLDRLHRLVSTVLIEGESLHLESHHSGRVLDRVSGRFRLLLLILLLLLFLLLLLLIHFHLLL
ncbi:hypothetical protein PMAYCL1PPCAC_02347, partial [Pristionchus mayeri]